MFSTQHPERIWICFFGLTIACFVSTVILVFSSGLQKVLGERGLIALERLMGMILTVVAVQMLLNGFASYLNLK